MSSVSEIMSEKEIVTITADSGKTAQDVADLMVKRKVGSVIVVDKNNQYQGIITERDMVKHVLRTSLQAESK
jgi:CBS domain-containing protein